MKRKAILWTRWASAAALSFIVLLPAAVWAQDPNSRCDALGTTVETRFPTPTGYVRVAAADDSFAAYLRRLPLKPHGAAVKLFDGRSKPNPGVYAAVIDLPIGRRDLHQCADAIIRLRAEYLFSGGRFDEIRFRFSNGFLAEYSRWRRGERIAVLGNAARWLPAARPGDRRQDFWRFLEMVFAYAGTASLARELAVVPAGAPQVGDVFIQPGHPGHAVIVVDAAVKRGSSRRIFLLAQSYMPAQELQVLQNPNDLRLSPWYAADSGNILVTPEWTFKRTNLKRFMD